MDKSHLRVRHKQGSRYQGITQRRIYTTDIDEFEMYESQSRVPFHSSYYNVAYQISSPSASEQSEEELGLNYDELLDLEQELLHNNSVYGRRSPYPQVSCFSPVDNNHACITMTHTMADQPFITDLQDPVALYQHHTFDDSCNSSHAFSPRSYTEPLMTSSSPPSPSSSTSESEFACPSPSSQHSRVPQSFRSKTPQRLVQPRRRQRQLYKFLMETLNDARYCPTFIEWIDRDAGVFRFVQPQKVATLWGERRHRESMSYEHLSRAMRYYYTRGIMKRAVDHGRLVYQFLQLEDTSAAVRATRHQHPKGSRRS